jgi:signal transduction histidine kinase
MRRNIIITGIASIFIAIALSALFARSIVVPIRRLSRAAQRIKEGELGTQVESYGRDEVGMLAEAFNEMSTAINERDKRLSRLNEELKQMSAGLAHEVRNPLNGMRIFLELLRRQCSEEAKTEEMINRVDDEIQSLDKIVTEFLDFARPNPLECGMVNLSEVIGTVFALLHTEAEDCGIQVNISDLESLPPIRADAEQLKGVFTNIMKNAIQAMPHGGTLNVSGKTIPADHIVRIEFVDTGIGIAQENIERIFDPFFTTSDTGTGLGLAIVKRLLEAHSGSIECQSAEGKGTTFIITLPVEDEDVERE